MSKRAPFYIDMPEGVKAALIRLKSACQRDGMDAIRVDYHDDSFSVYMRGNAAEPIRCVQLIGKDFYEYREVES
jgi:hypothetical protein